MYTWSSVLAVAIYCVRGIRFITHFRCRLPNRRFPDRVFVHAVRVHSDDHHRRTLVHHHLRHTPEPPAQARRLRQHNGHRLAVLAGHGRPATDGHQRLLEDQVWTFIIQRNITNITSLERPCVIFLSSCLHADIIGLADRLFGLLPHRCSSLSGRTVPQLPTRPRVAAQHPVLALAVQWRQDSHG